MPGRNRGAMCSGTKACLSLTSRMGYPALRSTGSHDTDPFIRSR